MIYELNHRAVFNDFFYSIEEPEQLLFSYAYKKVKHKLWRLWVVCFVCFLFVLLVINQNLRFNLVCLLCTTVLKQNKKKKKSKKTPKKFQ